VHQDQRRGVQFERALDHLARIDRRVVDCAPRLRLVGDQTVLRVEEQHAELLDPLPRQRGGEVVHQPVPVVQDRPLHRLGPRQAQRRRLHQLDRRDAVRPEPARGEQFPLRRREHGGEAAVPVDQRLRERLCVADLEGEEQQHLQQFIIGQCIGAAFEQLLAHPAAMAVRAEAGEGRGGGGRRGASGTAGAAEAEPPAR
jgi:hypothetical protein